MELITENKAGVHIVALKGDLDASNCLLLDSAISGALNIGVKKIQINCAGLDYISSAGLGVFVSYLSDFEAQKVDFTIINVKEKVLNTFKILGLDHLLTILP